MIRVLHVVENFNGQAVESWLGRMVCSAEFDPARTQFDFFLLGEGCGRDVDALRERGCGIHEGNRGAASIPQLARNLRRVVKTGEYDVVHMHQDVLAGIFSVALTGTGVRKITHCHNCWQRLPVGGVTKERVLTALARRLVLRCSDAIVGVSRQALERMTGTNRLDRRRDRVIYCSAKLAGRLPEGEDGSRCGVELRRRFGIPADAGVLLFMGRLDDYKNPLFALDVLGQMIASGGRDVHLVVAGVGGVVDRLVETARQRGIGQCLHCAGWVEDPVPLLHGVDLLLMPSLEVCGEGLGLVAVEAQGCGLPVLASLSVPEDAEVVRGLFMRKSLSEGAAAWADAAAGFLAAGRKDAKSSLKMLNASPFTNAASYAALCGLYSEVAGKAVAGGV